MNRRRLLTAIGIIALVRPKTLSAQTVDRVRRVAYLSPGSEDQTKSSVADFIQSLKDLGWVDGKNVHFVVRYADAEHEKFLTYAKELVELTPDVIVAITPLAVAAIQQQTHSIPIIFDSVGDPVAYGLVESVARPGGNVTGVSNFGFAMGGKWIEVLKEIAPATTNAAFIYHAATATQGYELYLRSVLAAAPTFGINVTEATVRDDAEIDRVIEEFSRKPNAGLIFPPDPYTIEHRSRIIEAAAQFRLPAVYTFDYFPKNGGLISYGVDPVEQNQLTANYVDRILRGAKPADLPVQGPTQFQVALNLKTAKALGLSVPQTLLVEADEVIE